MTEEYRRSTDEKRHELRDEELKQAIVELGDKLSKRMYALEAKVDPMYEMFSSVSGFNRISVWILKLLAAVGGAILGFYALLEFLKKIAK